MSYDGCWSQAQCCCWGWKHWPLCWCWASIRSSSTAISLSLSRAERVADVISSSWARSAFSLSCLGRRIRLLKKYLNHQPPYNKWYKWTNPLLHIQSDIHPSIVIMIESYFLSNSGILFKNALNTNKAQIMKVTQWSLDAQFHYITLPGYLQYA